MILPKMSVKTVKIEHYYITIGWSALKIKQTPKPIINGGPDGIM
jgi:hypothetical protein